MELTPLTPYSSTLYNTPEPLQGIYYALQALTIHISEVPDSLLCKTVCECAAKTFDYMAQESQMPLEQFTEIRETTLQGLMCFAGI